MGTTSFLHNGNIGDVWASLPAVKEYYRKTGKKAVYYLFNGKIGTYYEGATHPTVNADGAMCMLNEKMIEMMIPLLNAQEYIHEAKMFNGEAIDVDLNIIRETFVNMPMGMLSRWYFYVYPDLACDLSKPYISVSEPNYLAEGKVIIGRSERYQLDHIDYSFLKGYQEDILFTGTEKEHELFCSKFNLKIPKLVVSNFKQLAEALKSSNGLISNQTMVFQLAEGIKIPRVVELCNYAPNVVPIGEHAYDFYNQEALEYYFKLLLNKSN